MGHMLDPTCPVCATADIVCGKWTILVIRDLAERRSRFCELERSLEGISPRTLSLRLRARPVPVRAAHGRVHRGALVAAARAARVRAGLPAARGGSLGLAARERT